MALFVGILQQIRHFAFFNISESYLEALPTLFILSFLWVLSLDDKNYKCDQRIIDPRSPQFLFTYTLSFISISMEMVKFLRSGPIR